MANGTTVRPVDFTRGDLDAAVNEALSKVTDAAWIRAIHRAAANLSAGQFAFDGQHVVIRSASSSKRYSINVTEPMVCTCTAHERGLRCWHIVGARLLVRAAERHARQNNPGDPSFVPPLEARQNSGDVVATVSPHDALVAASAAVAHAYRVRPHLADRDPNWPRPAFTALTSATNAELFG